MYSYEIDKENVVTIYEENEETNELEGALIQPFWQNGEYFTDYADAEAWAKAQCDQLNGVTPEYTAGPSRDNNPVKLSEEELERLYAKEEDSESKETS